MDFALVGCGFIGHKRAQSLRAPHRLLWAADVEQERAQSLAGHFAGAKGTTDWRQALTDPAVGAVIVSTTNASLAQVALEAVRAGKHVLLEKPAGRTLAEVEALAQAQETERQKVRVRVGFNHRYHPGFVQARALLDAGEMGELMFVRARYGHGGRVGYDREWRADPALSGGGELLDQGVHLIDLARWFLGDFSRVEGHAATLFWDMPVDDNAFLSLRTRAGQTAWLHVSCTEWKNLFSFEIYGRHAKLHIEGLGGSYGVERLYFYKMLPEMGPPQTQIWEYPRGDASWQSELDEFVLDIEQERAPNPGLPEALAAMRVVQEIYQSSGYSS